MGKVYIIPYQKIGQQVTKFSSNLDVFHSGSIYHLVSEHWLSAFYYLVMIEWL